MNKHGFTLVELLAAIAVFSIISGIAIVSYTALVHRSKIKSFQSYEKTMYASAVQLLTEYVMDPSKASMFPRNGETKKFFLSDLEVDPIVNPINKNDLCLSSYVEVTRDDYTDSFDAHVDSFKYKVCLICEDYNATGNSCLNVP